MRRIVLVIVMLIAAASASAQEFNPIPRAWKWLGNEEVIFSYDGSFADSSAFVLNARNGKRIEGVTAPAKFSDFPVKPVGAVNLTYSPDSTKLAFTRDNDLYVLDIASGKETRLTSDGSDVILNGYASWVYYEEIFGRPSRYRAFWWSPDSRKIGFYRFDNSQVPMFPIYSAFANPAAAASQSQSPRVTDLALGGSLSETRYPKAGQTNPQVRIGIVDLDTVVRNETTDCHFERAERVEKSIIWADLDPTLDQYFGIPFWSPDSREFFIARMPRLQNTIDLYAVNVTDGSKRHVYNETYKTWLNWFDGVVFTDKGLYMAREFETGWQQIYFLSYDGKEFRRLTDGTNWNVAIVRVDEKKGDVYFTAKRDAVAKQALYKVDKKGVIKTLTDPAYNATGISFSPDGKYFVASLSNMTTPVKIEIFNSSKGQVSNYEYNVCADCLMYQKTASEEDSDNYLIPHSALMMNPLTSDLRGRLVADMAGSDFDPSVYALPEMVYLATRDGFWLPGMIVYPKNFDESKKYPVHVDIYGGPNTPMVRDRWVTPNATNQWYSENGIIQITVDPRAAGHNGRAGLDMIYRQLTVWEVKDFCEWAEVLQRLPYVDGDKIGVEGFSFGGTMTSMLLMQAPDKFHYGIAGGGVYDWALYDSHYTERYMDTPQNNPEGYEVSKVLNYVEGYPTEYATETVQETEAYTGASAERAAQFRCCAIEPVMLKLTHGTGDDNVHHQNTLQLLDVLHKAGKKFDFMIYPDGMHGYRGYQGNHFQNANNEFWLKYLKSE
ncbi:MAG: DPP IV N-terminal domain-containing protein [Bacteroidales bacterium]|nr:DPP IV N-terminal domain-containing protein [Bacteroidales bacterium]